MSNDSDDLSPAQRMFKRVPGTPFVDLAPEEKIDPDVSLALLQQLQGPMRDLARKIDAELAKLDMRIETLKRAPFKSCADFET